MIWLVPVFGFDSELLGPHLAEVRWEVLVVVIIVPAGEDYALGVSRVKVLLLSAALVLKALVPVAVLVRASIAGAAILILRKRRESGREDKEQIAKERHVSEIIAPCIAEIGVGDLWWLWLWLRIRQDLVELWLTKVLRLHRNRLLWL